MKHAPKDPSKPTPPLDESILALPASDPVVALRAIGNDTEVSLSPEKEVFTLGALAVPAVDLSLPFRHVSGLHCTIRRRGNRLHITDNESAAGLYFDDERRPGGEIKAGQVFRVGDVSLLALDQRLRDLRPLLMRLISTTDAALVDRTLRDIASGDRLLVLGPRRCDQPLLAEAIHKASTRRGRAFVHVQPPLATEPERTAVLRHADRGTAFLDLDELKLTAHFADELYGATYHVRPIFAARRYSVAREQLGEERARVCRQLIIPPLADRAEEIPALLDTICVDDLKSTIAPSKALKPKSLDLIRKKRFRNLDELRSEARRLNAIIRHDFNRAAAAVEAEITLASFDEWADRIDV